MTERRYGFRFSAIEAGFLVIMVVLVSLFVFVAGVYVGKGVEAHKTAQLTPPVRMPIQIPDEPRVTTDTPVTWKLPKDKPVGATPSVTSGIAENSAPAPTSSTSTPAAAPAVSATKKARPKDVSPGERLSPVAGMSQPKTDEPPQSSLTTRKSSLTEEPALSRTTTVHSLPNENLFDTREAPSPAQKATRPTKGWRVQVEATNHEETAQEIAKALRAQGYDPSVSKVTKQGEVWYRVRVGRFTTQEEAVAAITRFRREGKFSQAYLVSE